MTAFDVRRRNACKTRMAFVLHKQKSTCGLLRHSYSYTYTQETGTLKATATTGMFFVIGRVILSIDDRHISPCNSLLVHPSLVPASSLREEESGQPPIHQPSESSYFRGMLINDYYVINYLKFISMS